MSDKKAKITESEALAKLAVLGIENKKGLDTVVLDLRGVQSAPANFFVICSGNVPSHVSAICDGVFETVKKATGYNPNKIEGYDNAEWITSTWLCTSSRRTSATTTAWNSCGPTERK